MKKKLMYLGLAALLVNTAFAANRFSFFKGNKKYASEKVRHLTKKPTKYTDFSGTWKGQCTINGRSKTVERVIKNDPDYINLGENSFLIDNVSTNSDFDKYGGRFGHIRFHWMDTGALMGDVVMLDFDYAYPDSSLSVLVAQISLAIENDKLIVNVTDKTVVGDVSQDPAYKEECVLEKLN